MKIVIHGASGFEDVPGLEDAGKHAHFEFAPDEHSLADALPGAEILVGWDFRGRDLANQWSRASALKWIHWCGAGVDAVMFPELASSPVILTNSRGIFDRAMAEYVLGYMLSQVKDFPASWRHQSNREWNYRTTAKLAGARAAIFGVGSIGREIANLLKAVGVEVTGVGRSARDDDPVFGTVNAQGDALDVAANADWVVAVLPGTAATESYFTTEFFAAMKPTARFINIGRGAAVDEAALVSSLRAGDIAGAMLDVFRTEPLPATSPLWETPGLFVSPHMSGDYADFADDVVRLLLDNLDRYRSGQTLVNVVDKELGFVAQ